MYILSRDRIVTDRNEGTSKPSQNDMTLPREARKSKAKIFLHKLRMGACGSTDARSFKPGISSLKTEDKVLGMAKRGRQLPRKEESRT